MAFSIEDEEYEEEDDIEDGESGVVEGDLHFLAVSFWSTGKMVVRGILKFLKLSSFESVEDADDKEDDEQNICSKMDLPLREERLCFRLGVVDLISSPFSVLTLVLPFSP